MKTVLLPALMLLIGTTNAIRFVSKGFELLDPKTGRVVLPRGRGESFIRFAPPVTDEIVGGSRNPRQIFFKGYDSDFYSASSQQPHFRKERKVIPFHYGSGSRYQSAQKSTYAHKKRQQNPYYGKRKKRSAQPEPYTLIDPWTGRNLNKIQEKPKQRQNNFLFGLPFFNNGHGFLKENVRLQRRVPNHQPLYDPYLSTNGIPLYRYRKKHPHGYGRKKREARSPWILLDPTTGRTLKPEQVKTTKNTGSLDPLEQQFQIPGLRSERRPTKLYLSNSGVPLYKYRNKYPHGYLG